MNRTIRRSLALSVTLSLMAFAPPATGAERHVDDYRLAATAAVTASASPEPCADRAYKLTGGKWTTTLKWSFRASSTPTGLTRAAARTTIQRAFGNIVNARNDCGRSDRVGAKQSYLGTTSSKPNCNVMDGRNVVGFRSLPGDTLAQTCWWTVNGRIVEADIQINSTLPWATSLAGCRNKYMLEAVMTHEVGHAFGLGHVGETKHGRLTMSTRLDGPCNNQESTLGLGDLRGLEALY
jgi:hypothetical protein